MNPTKMNLSTIISMAASASTNYDRASLKHAALLSLMTKARIGFFSYLDFTHICGKEEIVLSIGDAVPFDTSL